MKNTACAKEYKKGHACPHCGKPLELKPFAKTDAVFPFCSERCKIIDLGNWASGRYIVKGQEIGLANEKPLHCGQEE